MTSGDEFFVNFLRFCFHNVVNIECTIVYFRDFVKLTRVM